MGAGGSLVRGKEREREGETVTVQQLWDLAEEGVLNPEGCHPHGRPMGPRRLEQLPFGRETVIVDRGLGFTGHVRGGRGMPGLWVVGEARSE